MRSEHQQTLDRNAAESEAARFRQMEENRAQRRAKAAAEHDAAIDAAASLATETVADMPAVKTAPVVELTAAACDRCGLAETPANNIAAIVAAEIVGNHRGSVDPVIGHLNRKKDLESKREELRSQLRGGIDAHGEAVRAANRGEPSDDLAAMSAANTALEARILSFSNDIEDAASDALEAAEVARNAAVADLNRGHTYDAQATHDSACFAEIYSLVASTVALCGAAGVSLSIDPARGPAAFLEGFCAAFGPNGPRHLQLVNAAKDWDAAAAKLEFDAAVKARKDWDIEARKLANVIGPLSNPHAPQILIELLSQK